MRLSIIAQPYSKLSVGVNESVNGCLSQCGPAMLEEPAGTENKWINEVYQTLEALMSAALNYQVVFRIVWSKSTLDRSDMDQGHDAFCCVSVSAIRSGLWAAMWTISGTSYRSDFSPLLFQHRLPHLSPFFLDPLCALTVNSSSPLWRRFYLRSDAETSGGPLLSVWTTNRPSMKVVEKAKTHKWPCHFTREVTARSVWTRSFWAPLLLLSQKGTCRSDNACTWKRELCHSNFLCWPVHQTFLS